jgi:hypothetical protein
MPFRDTVAVAGDTGAFTLAIFSANTLMNDFMPSPYAALSSIFALCPVNALLTSGCISTRRHAPTK